MFLSYEKLLRRPVLLSQYSRIYSNIHPENNILFMLYKNKTSFLHKTKKK